MGQASGNMAGFVGKYLLDWGMRNKQDREQNELLEREDKWRTDQLARQDRDREDRLRQWAKDRADKGIVDPSVAVAPPRVETGVSLPESPFDPQQNVGAIGSAMKRMMGATGLDTPASLNAPIVQTDGGYNSDKDVEYQRRLAQTRETQALAATQRNADNARQVDALVSVGIPRAEAVTMVETGIDPAVRRRQLAPPERARSPYQYVEGGSVFDPNTGDIRTPEGGVTRPQTATEAKAQQQATSALASLDNYEQLATAYLSRSRPERMLGQAGWGLDKEIGQIEAAKNALLLEVKDLAQLGVLSAQDETIINRLIGDPTSLVGTARDPEYTMAKFDQARRYLEGKMPSGAIGSMSGTAPPQARTPEGRRLLELLGGQ